MQNTKLFGGAIMNTRFTRQEEKDIHKDLENGCTQVQLAKEKNSSQPTISRANKRSFITRMNKVIEDTQENLSQLKQLVDNYNSHTRYPKDEPKNSPKTIPLLRVCTGTESLLYVCTDTEPLLYKL